MQNVNFVGAIVSEFRCFQKDEEEQHGQSVHHVIFSSSFFGLQLLFHMFSTLISLEDRLN